MGGSTPVPLNIRMKVWLEMVPALLQKLNVKHVSLLCHSAGTLYGLNTLYYLRDILDPERPFVALICPWVHNEHSEAMLTNLASRIPTSMFNSWHSIVGFINQKIAPSVSWSGGVVSSVSGIFSSDSSSSSDDNLVEKYGTAPKVAKEIERLVGKYFFEGEDVTGANEEAKLCLKKKGPGAWMICEDYQAHVESLTQQEKERVRSGSERPRLKVHAYFAESDVMIGKGGQKYFEQLWSQDGVSESIEYQSHELPGTNHDSVLIDHKKGALKTIFEEVKRPS